jgi:hypothetical protein
VGLRSRRAASKSNPGLIETETELAVSHIEARTEPQASASPAKMAPTLSDIKKMSEKMSALNAEMEAFKEQLAEAMKVEDVPKVFFTKKRRTMWRAFKAGGWLAVSQWMEGYGLREFVSDNAYKYFDEDARRTDKLLPFILSTIYHKVMEAVILGTVPQLENDTDARTTIIPRTDVGIYSNCFYYTGHVERADPQRSSPAPQMEHEVEKGFSVDDYQLICDTMREYMNDPRVAAIIDNNPGPAKNVTSTGKRFAKNPSQIGHLNDWRSSVRRLIIDNPPYPTNRAKKLESCPQYQGYGKQAAHRVLQHKENASTSVIWGLVNGVLRNYFHGKWKESQNQLNYICGREYADLAEAGCSVLGSSYHDEGGLNPTRAGGTPSMTTAADIRDYELRCGRNIDHLLENNGNQAVRSARRQAKEKNDLLKKYLTNKQDPQKMESLELKADTKKNADALLKEWTNLQKTEEYLRGLLLRDRLAELMKEFKAGGESEIQVPRTPK